MSIEVTKLKEVIDQLVETIKKQLEGNTLVPLTENKAVRELGIIIAILTGLRDKTEDESLKEQIWSLKEEAADTFEKLANRFLITEQSVDNV
ncbi:hypothetical protein OR571_07995 [Psychrobacillus sp. NEAU-3TGS]|uniref:hypothetical protein n=1 Tax=Psychrobacillus sp. NEAU-3TGS TaxID=2995412 RepID=UPI002496E5C1|nr:hypothetical protein [Psychrobacillus sp. NEAU-3TGS]MDI2587046.1 hypothetical protein [Psychrobacillus sp. NEAU-3TGS]